MNTDLMFSSANDVWSTPQWLFDALDKEFGFTLDPVQRRHERQDAEVFQHPRHRPFARLGHGDGVYEPALQ
jgi:hypothetical protein